MYVSVDISKRIKLKAKEQGISVKKLLEDVGLGFNTMANMKTSMPKADNLAKIADYLNCSVDYLLGRTDVPEINRKISFINDGDFTVVQKAAFDGGEVGGKNPDISKYGKILELTDKDN